MHVLDWQGYSTALIGSRHASLLLVVTTPKLQGFRCLIVFPTFYLEKDSVPSSASISVHNDRLWRNADARQHDVVSIAFVYTQSELILKPHCKWDLQELDDGSACLFVNFWLLHKCARTRDESCPSSVDYAYTHTHTHTHTRTHTHTHTHRNNHILRQQTVLFNFGSMLSKGHSVH
jgi:hydroxyacyl-ACP dehydratase HTD2-like protein with hotdog domain